MIKVFILWIACISFVKTEVIYNGPSGETIINGDDVGNTVISSGIGNVYSSITSIPGNTITIENSTK